MQVNILIQMKLDWSERLMPYVVEFDPVHASKHLTGLEAG